MAPGHRPRHRGDWLSWGFEGSDVLAASVGWREDRWTESDFTRREVPALRENLAAVEQGPLSAAEMSFMRELGRAVHG